MEKDFSNEAKDHALLTAYTVLVLALRDTGALTAPAFLGHAISARNRLIELGHTECVEAFDSIIQPLSSALGPPSVAPGPHQPRGG